MTPPKTEVLLTCVCGHSIRVRASEPETDKLCHRCNRNIKVLLGETGSITVYVYTGVWNKDLPRHPYQRGWVER